jgi:hypothetical protein
MAKRGHELPDGGLRDPDYLVHYIISGKYMDNLYSAGASDDPESDIHSRNSK